ncbi:MAG: SAM-dependent methyltransferase [Anaerolineae bacterium]|nr:SAM-dependent methyltransferase [Anaerolineae bacterium]
MGVKAKRIALPGEGLDVHKMPGHWLLARLGKRVLRPGGLELTQQMLAALDIQVTDAVVEFAPGLGVTTQLTLSRQPASYLAIEQDETAAQKVRQYLTGPKQQCLVGQAEATGLPPASATVIYGEAMLTMQTPAKKQQIVEEAFQVLQPGGRYGLHELCLLPDDLASDKKEEISRALSAVIHVGARPLTPSEWRDMLIMEGFTVQAQATAPMHLLEPGRFIQDEGIAGVLRFSWNVLYDGAARQRVVAMRSIFRKYQEYLAAIMLVGVKPN